MKSLKVVLQNFNTRCIDGRDVVRLAEYTPKDKLHYLGLNIEEDVPHEPKVWSKKNILKDLERDIQFGYEKAVDERGISSALMLSVIEMWEWVLSDNDEVYVGEYTFFRPDALREFKRLAEKYNVDLGVMTMNKNQETLLEYLSSHYFLFSNSFEAIWNMQGNYIMGGVGNKELDYAMEHLTPQEQFEILIKFGEWGLKNE